MLLGYVVGIQWMWVLVEGDMCLGTCQDQLHVGPEVLRGTRGRQRCSHDGWIDVGFLQSERVRESAAVLLGHSVESGVMWVLVGGRYGDRRWEGGVWGIRYGHHGGMGVCGWC